MRIKTALSIICLLSLLLGSFPGFAQQKPYRLDGIVVTANREAMPLLEAPANVSIITKEDIEAIGATTVTDVFKCEPGIFTSNLLNNPKYTQIDIRGYGETAPSNVLFLIDGRRINGIDMSGADLSVIPLDMIERVEIYRGSATALFGDNAVAGAVNFIMKQGEGKPTVKASVLAGSDNLFTSKLSVLGKQDKFSYYGLASSYDTDGYRRNNALHMRDLIGNFTFDAFKDLTVYLQTGHHWDTYGMPGVLTSDDLATGRFSRTDTKNPDDSANTEDNFANLGADINFGDIVLCLNGSYRLRHASSAWALSNWYSMRTFETYGFMPKLIVNKPIFGLRNSLVAGFDYYRSPTRSSDYSPGLWGTDSVTKITKTDSAFYINDEIAPIKDLLLNFAYRAQKSSWDIDYLDNLGMNQPINNSVNVWKDAFRISANYLFDKKGNMFITYAKGFRTPTTDELLSVFAVPPINESLKTQTTREIDIGARYNFVEWIGGGVTYFQSRTDDEIYYNPFTFANGNYDKTRRDGVEASLYLVPLKELAFNFLYSYTNAVFDGGDFDGNRIPLVSRNKFSVKLTYFWNDLTANVILTYLGDRYMVSDQQNQLRELPGVTTVDVNFKYAWKGLEAMFGIKNLTDKQYSEYGVASYPFGQPPTANYYPSPGRQFYAGLSYKY
ncbi:MAG: TonB-dependent receptor [Syntrophorhabdaceae bacterium]|nr:TonB-dependent receptor [Syntrophorhabdaceae bacterium]